MARSQEFRRGTVPPGPPSSFGARPFCATCQWHQNLHPGGSDSSSGHPAHAEAKTHEFVPNEKVGEGGSKVKPIPENLKGIRSHLRKDHFTPYAGYNYLHDAAGPNKDRPKITSGEHRPPEPSMDIEEARRQHEVEHHLWGGDHSH